MTSDSDAILVEVAGVVVDFGSLRAVDHVSLTVASGEVVGLLGANGAGKTTLVRMILGLLAPSRGSVMLLGGAPSIATRRRLGYLPQGLGLYEDLTVAENLAFSSAAFGVLAPELTGDLGRAGDTVVSNLSLGLRRRVAFAAALAHQPELLVLDEPTSGVGPLGRARLWDTIHEKADRGAGLIVTTHHMDEAEQCDRLVVLSAGRVVASGTTDEIVAGRTAVEFGPTDPADALTRLERAGILALPLGDAIRVVGSDVEAVRAALGSGDGHGFAGSITIEPATLEEAFMQLVTRGNEVAA